MQPSQLPAAGAGGAGADLPKRSAALGSRIRPRSVDPASAGMPGSANTLSSRRPQVDFQALSPVLELAGHRPGPCPVQVRAQAGLPLGAGPAPRAQRPALRQALLPIAGVLATGGEKARFGVWLPRLLPLSLPQEGLSFLTYGLGFFVFNLFPHVVSLGSFLSLFLKGCSEALRGGSRALEPRAPGIHLHGNDPGTEARCCGAASLCPLVSSPPSKGI